MNTRGFTTVEVLVALGLMLTVLATIYSGVRPQVRHAGSQVRVASMQQAARGAFDLFARDMRMAGFGVIPKAAGMPPSVDLESEAIVVYGNYGNVQTTGSGSGTVVDVADTSGFKVNNHLAIEGFFGSEAKEIVAVAPASITLASPLTRAYPAGSRIHQIEPLRYRVSGGTLLRNNTPMADGVLANTVQYYLAGGSLVSDPTGVDRDVRTTLVAMEMQTTDRPSGADPETMSVQAEVRVRNLGLMEESW